MLLVHLQDLVYDVDSFDDLYGQLLFRLHFLGGLEQELEHFGHLLPNEGNGPLEQVHKVGQEVGVGVLEKLLNVQCVILSLIYCYHEFNDGCLVIVEIAVVGGRKNSDYGRELFLACPVVHLESIRLGFVSPDYGQQFVLAEEALRKLIAKEVGTPSHLVFFDQLLHCSCSIVNRIGPHQVAEEPRFGDFPKSVNFLNIVELTYRNSTFLISAEIPPWMHKNLLLTNAARGRQSNNSMKES